jgi:hypothetical protein
MRSRRLVPALVLGLALALALGACGSTVDGAAPTRTTATAAPPTHRLADPAVVVATSDGMVSVRTATGQVGFRAPNGIVSPDRSTIVQAEAMTTGTRVVASDAATGTVRWSHDVPGNRRVRVASPGGRFVALVDGNLSYAASPRATTTVDVATATGAHRYRFAGNFDPEAFSTDGHTLFVLDFLPAMKPTRYSVREVDLASGAIRAVPDRDGSIRAPMPGYALAQAMSPDGTQLYTFYASSEPISGDDGDQYHAWIHVLNLQHKWAHCLELDEDIGIQGGANAALAVSADSKRLYVSDRLTGAFVSIDTASLRATRTRFVRDLETSTGAVLAATGDALYANAGPRGVVRLDARTLEPDSGTFESSRAVLALQVDRSGQALYVLATDGLFVVDPRGRVLERWAAPGSATSIAPSPMPGRGTYFCAC